MRGAGVGILSAAFVAEMCSRKSRPKKLTITAYELDPLLREYLDETYDACRAAAAEAGIELMTEFRADDFIEDGAATLRGGS